MISNTVLYRNMTGRSNAMYSLVADTHPKSPWEIAAVWFFCPVFSPFLVLYLLSLHFLLHLAYLAIRLLHSCSVDVQGCPYLSVSLHFSLKVCQTHMWTRNNHMAAWMDLQTWTDELRPSDKLERYMESLQERMREEGNKRAISESVVSSHSLFCFCLEAYQCLQDYFPCFEDLRACNKELPQWQQIRRIPREGAAAFGGFSVRTLLGAGIHGSALLIVGWVGADFVDQGGQVNETEVGAETVCQALAVTMTGLMSEAESKQIF